MFSPKIIASTFVVCIAGIIISLALLYPDSPEQPFRMDLVKQFRSLNKTCFILGAS
ncbi:hypothetical protein BV898_20085, partial [Hypsibius exemplaris]